MSFAPSVMSHHSPHYPALMVLRSPQHYFFSSDHLWISTEHLHFSTDEPWIMIKVFIGAKRISQHWKPLPTF